MSWHKTDLANVIGVLESGSRPKGGVSTDTGEVMSLGGENIVQQGGVELRDVKRVPQAFYEAMTKGHLLDRDVLINKDGANTGKVGLFRDPGEGPACINEHLFLLRGEASKITQEYLYYTLLSERGQTIIRNRISGSAQPGLKSGFINNFPIDLPESTDEQEQIGGILGTLDRAIEQTEALIAKQQRIKTGLMQDLLTKGIDEHGNIRSETTHAFKDSPLGRIPVEWKVTPMSTFQLLGRPFIKTGPFGSSLNTKHWVEDGVPVITIGSLGDGGFLKQELLYISELTAHALSPYRVNPGDIVFSRVADIGRALVITTEQNGWIISSNFMRISLNVSEVSPSFFYRTIVFNPTTRNQLRVLSNASGREVVNTAILSALHFAWPDLGEQNRINDKLDQIDKVINKSRHSLEKLVAFKRGLMHDLLTGQRRVTSLLAQPAS